MHYSRTLANYEEPPATRCCSTFGMIMHRIHICAGMQTACLFKQECMWDRSGATEDGELQGLTVPGKL